MMHRIFFLVLILALAPFTSAHADSFTVEVDKARVMRLPGRAATVVIGNPAIADAAIYDGNLVFVTGKIYGTTNIIVLNALGQTIVDRELTVIAPQVAAITYHRGSAQRSYTCRGNCEAIPNIGDDSDVFNNLMKQQKKKTEQGTAAAGAN